MAHGTIAFPRLSMFSREQCGTIHRASLEILRRTGVRIFHEGALALLRDTDAVISNGNLVQFPAGLVEWALKQAPSRVPLCRRGKTGHARRHVVHGTARRRRRQKAMQLHAGTGRG